MKEHKKYYKRYKRKEGQSAEDWHKAMLEQYEGEGPERYERRIQVVKQLFPEADWAHVDYNSGGGQYEWRPRGAEDESRSDADDQVSSAVIIRRVSHVANEGNGFWYGQDCKRFTVDVL